MAVEIKHIFDFSGASDLFTRLDQTLNNLSERMQNMGSSGGSISSMNIPEQEIPSIQKEKIQSQAKSFDLITGSNDRLSNLIKNNLIEGLNRNTKGIEDQTKIYNDHMNQNKQGLITDKELNKNLQALNKQLQQPSNNGGGFSGNLIKGILGLGWASEIAKIGSLVSQQGSIVGTAQQSLNTNVMGSGQFMQQYQAQVLSNEQQIQNTTANFLLGGAGGILGGVLGAGATGAAIGSVLGIPGTALGGAIGAGVGLIGGALYGYEGNKSTQQEIANNQFRLQQDMAAWQMRNLFGFSSITTPGGFSSNGRSYSTSLSILQQQMLANPQERAFAYNAPEYIMSANRQQMLGENPRNMIPSMTTAAALMGVAQGEMPQFINSITTLAMATGKQTNKLLQEQVNLYERYGGDTAKNTAQSLQLLQTTHLGSPEQIQDLVSRYQYNQAALQNMANVSNATPINAFVGSTLLHMAGWSDEEIKQGRMNPAHQAAYHKAIQAGTSRNPGGIISPLALLTPLGAQQYGINPNVNAAAIMRSVSMPGANIESMVKSQNLPTQMRAMTDFVSDALNNLTVGTQNVQATTVYVNGSLNNSGTSSNSGRKALASISANKIDAYSNSRMKRSQASKSGMSAILTHNNEPDVPPIMRTQ